MIEFLKVFMIVVLIVIGVPFTVYLSVKLGRYAYLKAGQAFHENNSNQTKE